MVRNINLRTAVGATVALFIGAILVAMLVPIAIGAITDPSTATYQQDTEETVTISGDLQATLDSVDTTADTATYTVFNDDNTDTVTVGLDETGTATVGDTEVSVTPTEIVTDSATTTYEYPTTYSWSDSATSLWIILPLVIVLVPFLFFVRVAMNNA